MARKKAKTVAPLESEVYKLELELGILKSGKKWEAILSLGKPAIMWGTSMPVYKVLERGRSGCAQ